SNRMQSSDREPSEERRVMPILLWTLSALFLASSFLFQQATHVLWWSTNSQVQAEWVELVCTLLIKVPLWAVPLPRVLIFLATVASSSTVPERRKRFLWVTGLAFSCSMV